MLRAAEQWWKVKVAGAVLGSTQDTPADVGDAAALCHAHVQHPSPTPRPLSIAEASQSEQQQQQ